MTFGTGIYDKDRMIVPVAIREDVVVRVQMPTDITRAEAEKVAKVVLAYASADTHPKDGDVKQAPLVSGAVPKADAQTVRHD